MDPVIVVGVDPGLVHTGVVFMQFFPASREVLVDSKAVLGPDPVEVRQFFGMYQPAHIFIEGYRPRSHYGTDEPMLKAVAAMKAGLPNSIVLQNTGIKKVVKRPLLEALKCWSFATTTHHQDLRSAAYIAVLGMMKDDQLNELLSDFVRDLADRRPWNVQHQ